MRTIKVPSFERSVPKPLNVPSLARPVPKPLKLPSLARSVAKALKCLVLHVLCPSLFLLSLGKPEVVGSEVREYDSPKLIVSEVKVKVKVKVSESIFGPLFFFNLRYIKGGVRGNNNIGIKKCTTIFLWE